MPWLVRALCLLAWSPISLAIQDSLRILEAHRVRSRHFKEPTRQILTNHNDMLYTGTMLLGGEQIEGILDTGSFELVVFGAKCDTCGTAVAYNNKKSCCYQNGKFVKFLAYGSGSCYTEDAFDDVAIAGLTAHGQAFWEATQCAMSLLLHAEFNAIVGLGPPGEPVYEAQVWLANVQQQLISAVGPERSHLLDLLEEAKISLKLAESKTDLLDSLSVNRFSACFGRDAGSDGYHIWNDVSRDAEAGVVSVPVPGNITWSMKVTGVDLIKQGSGTKVTVGCFENCGAIVDTGTTLIGVHTDMYINVFDYVRTFPGGDCSDLSTFPDLVFNIDGGKQLVLPPSSYISLMSYGGFASEDVKRLLHLDRPSPFMDKRNGNVSFSSTQQNSDDGVCMFMLMDMGDIMTALGYQMIIGTAVFREYYTTFDLGSGRGDRTMYFSPANANCEPASEQELAQSNYRSGASSSYRSKPRSVDAREIRVPRRSAEL